MPFAQIVVGPPGSGKTTYCHGLFQLFSQTKRECAIVNLDPANENIPYKCDIDISSLITLEDAIDTFGLGPNGGMIYCLEYLEKNIDWLLEQLDKIKDKYIIFDCPGQVELYTHNNAIKNIISILEKRDYRLCVVHLVDAHHCTDPSKYISVLLLSLQIMLQLGLPHVNVLSKVDLMESYGKLAFNLDFYTEVQDLHYLLEQLNSDNQTARYQRLNEALVDLIEDYNLVGFYTLCVEDKDSMINLVRVIDKANGYIYGGLEEANESIMITAARVGGLGSLEDIKEVQERYLRNTWEEKEGQDEDQDFANVNDII
ncbi:hypothetical protein BCR36DRAFT_352177 [Piromyces finnis]|uniref:GPN-loop GTPase 2 n=1 Tax=Piromyces finnis TaxID=1754191 RepID=A0A1Y1V9Z3_9FUNG|nr:hypothetical protein BCR36DRAFT_352177 [Piromyces finnis]|eukprot:ORX50781.1 hypothetical protein BCR36DRAFT_352177 [Piromyces finnis]